MALKFYAGAGKAHMEKYGGTLADFAKVRAAGCRSGGGGRAGCARPSK